MVKGSCRVRYAMEPLDQELGAEINRRSPRSADPDSYNCQSLTPPPWGIRATRDAFDSPLVRRGCNFTIAKANQH